MMAATQIDLKALKALRFPKSLGTAGSGILALGLASLLASAACALLGKVTWPGWQGAQLLGLLFPLSMGLGALFWVLIQHLTHAGWSVVVRRIAEGMAGAFPYLLVGLFIVAALPFAGDESVFSWAHASAADDHILHEKAPYLNPVFFACRIVGYGLIWSLLGRFFFRRSLHQDQTSDRSATLAMERFSPVGVVLFGLTITFAGVDLIMSLEPHWFSTIVGIYLFAGSCVAALAVWILVAAYGERRGWFAGAVTTEHFHDLGKLLFGFNFFWAYIAFSQFMLIWYADIPEETMWYLPRQEGAWVWVALTLIVGHFVIPFIGFMSRIVKRSRGGLQFWAVWLLAMHALDLAYWVLPSHTLHHLGEGFALTAALAAVGFLLLFIGGLMRTLADKPTIPVGDPRLADSLHFHNI